MKLVLDYDDFHWKEPENCIISIKELVTRFPSIKINLFTVPKHTNYPLESNKQWCREVKSLIDSGNIQLCTHGLTHSHLEFLNLGTEETIARLDAAHTYFNRAGLPFAKVFKGPNWGINPNTYAALIEKGYTHIFSHQDYKPIVKPGIISVFYNWNLKDEFNGKEDLIIGHGHTWNVCDNGIAQTLERISNFIESNHPEFLFANEICH